MATLTPVPAQFVAPRRPWNTLEILSRSRTVLFVLTALLAATIVSATQIHRHAMTVVGRDTAPSIIAAQQIKSALADMDAEAVDGMLNPENYHAVSAYEKRRVQASNALIGAAKNITYKTEYQPIQTIELMIGTYEQRVQEARDQLKDKQKDAALNSYHDAANMMDKILLPAADKLDDANNDMLEREYDAQSTRSFAARALVLLLGGAALLALVLMQLFLSRRMQRTLNPALLAATLLTLALTIASFGAMTREASDLRAAKQDAFDSVRALLRARAVAYAAHSDESRFLLDPIHAEEYAQDFRRKSLQLAQLPAQRTREQLAAELRSGQKVPGLAGLLADELNNITYPGEREAADESLLDYQRYLEVDQQIRSLESSGQHEKAIALEAGDQEGQLDWAFTQFDDALGRTLTLNEREFKQAVDSGFSAVANLDWEACIAGIVLAVLIFFGFAPRIREYQ